MFMNRERMRGVWHRLRRRPLRAVYNRPVRVSPNADAHDAPPVLAADSVSVYPDVVPRRLWIRCRCDRTGVDANGALHLDAFAGTATDFAAIQDWTSSISNARLIGTYRYVVRTTTLYPGPATYDAVISFVLRRTGP
jgi:hypothetical protein